MPRRMDGGGGGTNSEICIYVLGGVNLGTSTAEQRMAEPLAFSTLPFSFPRPFEDVPHSMVPKSAL